MPDRGNRRDRIPKPPAPQSNPLAEGLVLSFEHTDLRGLDEEGDNIVKAFRSIGCPCHKYSIKSERRVQDKLKRFLAEGATPRIIYFHGHGRSLDNSLTFSSHKSRQVGGENYQKLHWQGVADVIMDAKCPVLVILDCCNAGAAAATPVNLHSNRYPKELIAATSWGLSTSDKLAIALCNVLKPWAESSRSRSARSLHERINKELSELRTNEKRRVESRIDQLKDDLAKTNQRIEKLEDKLKSAKRELRHPEKLRDRRRRELESSRRDLEKEIDRLTERTQSQRQKITEKEERLANLRKSIDSYRQAHHSRWMSMRQEWVLQR